MSIAAAPSDDDPVRTDILVVSPSTRARDLCGPSDQTLVRIENALGVTLSPRGDRIAVTGDGYERDLALKALRALDDRLEKGLPVELADIDAAVRFAQAGADTGARQVETPRRVVTARTAAQSAYLEALAANDLTFGVGPAGTGKTYLAVAAAVSMLTKRMVDKLVLCRPAVEAGERIGFLPGDMKEKVDPYLRPLYDALADMLHAEPLNKAMLDGRIEVAPLAFMRGRTFTRAFVILDEAQNATVGQMKMFLTRLGEGSRMAVTGDPTQTDLPPRETSGLADALGLLTGLNGVSVARFSAADVVRHPMVARIVDAYDAREKALRKGPAAVVDNMKPTE
ncbi:MAG: PhoH family protein [Pseudomonadota bacterium]